MNPEIQQLKNDIEDLKKWKEERMRQQISFPLDIHSIETLMNYFMRILSTVETVSGVGGNVFINYIGKQGNLEFQVDKNTFIPYTVNATTNVFTNTQIVFQNDMQVYVSTEDTAPAPLVAGDPYFIVNASGLTFQLSATQGGAAINITDTGVGRQYIFFF